MASASRWAQGQKQAFGTQALANRETMEGNKQNKKAKRLIFYPRVNKR